MQQPLFVNALFEDVQKGKIFPDGKTFADCVPKISETEIAAAYEAAKTKEDFNLKEFVLEYYAVPVPHSSTFTSDRSKSAKENIELLWDALTRMPASSEGTLIALPYPYIVPGGRFGEIYYWDSYFTMLGLKVSGRASMIENMVENFSYLIDAVGYIPNGNRTYFIGRSQPPFYSLMVKLLSEIKGEKVIGAYLPQLLKEYEFWMKGKEFIKGENGTSHHVVRKGDILLNRYWDENSTPRPESYREDIELAESSAAKHELYRHLRAGAESGWDYSSRWFKDEWSFATIHTADIVPVDLNCLLYHLEQTIAEAYNSNHDLTNANRYKTLAEKRSRLIQQYCWNHEQQFFVDYDFAAGKQKSVLTLAGVAPLYFNIATQPQADAVAEIIQTQFLKAGGLITTLKETGQQWDAPNGWAPLQWMAIVGLENYGHRPLAKEIAQRWLQLNTMVYNRTGKMMEKYNVVDPTIEAGGGEYAGQDGFGWTNGVFLALREKRF